MAKLKKFDGREGRPGVHRFDTQLRRGLRGEQHVNAHLAGRYDVSNPQRQSDGIDALGSVKSQGALGVASSERGRGAARDLSALSI